MVETARTTRTWYTGRSLLVALLMAGLSGLLSWVWAAGDEASWEMRVCAPPFDAPASSREDGGFNNEIARILADQMNARVTFVWTRLNARNIQDTLMSGDCDVVVGVSEGAGGVASTVPYLRVPYVFVSREDTGLDVTSLDDPALRDLRIGTYPTGVPSLALENRGITENVTEFAPVDAPGGLDRDRAILDAVVEEEIDLGIVYGPRAAATAADLDVPLRIVPVRPEIDAGATLLRLFRTWTIGVRPHDESFRDRLNLALAARWEDVQAAIDAYGVLRLDVQRPPERTARRGPAVGLVAPADSGGNVPLAEVGMAALHGAEFAENAIARDVDRAGEPARVLYASAPTNAAAVRAAERLVATENVYALIGGFGSGEAAALGQIAQETGILFLNIAAVDDTLRGEACRRTTFHVEASESMYVDAAVDWFLGGGTQRVFVVHEADAAGDALAQRVAEKVAAADGEGRVVGRAAVDRGQFVYADAISAAVEADADLVVLLLGSPEDQALFTSQATGSGLNAITGLTSPMSQTRPFLHRLRSVNSEAGRTPRVVLWEPSLEEGAAGELNERYASRTNEPMEPTAWAAYAAVVILDEALAAVGESTADSLVAYFEGEATSFDVGKTTDVSFRPWNHQLRQELYVVQAIEGASLGRRVAERMAFAEALRRLPLDATSDAPAALDRYGSGAGGTCEF